MTVYRLILWQATRLVVSQAERGATLILIEIVLFISKPSYVQNYIIRVQHLQYKSPRYNIKIAGLFAPATSTFIHRTTTHFISLFCYPHPYKNRSPQPITPPRFAPLYRTSSPHITVPKALPWQMKNTFIIVLFLLDLPGNALFCGIFWEFVIFLFYVSTRQIIA